MQAVGSMVVGDALGDGYASVGAYVDGWLTDVAAVPLDTMQACRLSRDPANLHLFVVLPCGSKKTTVITSIVLMSRLVCALADKQPPSPSSLGLLGTPLVCVVVVPVLTLGRQHQDSYWFNGALDRSFSTKVHGGAFTTFLWNHDSTNPGPASIEDHYDIVFVSPESVCTTAFIEWYDANLWRVFAVFVDEAHYLLTDASYRRYMLTVGSHLGRPGVPFRFLDGTIPLGLLPAMYLCDPFVSCRLGAPVESITLVKASETDTYVRDNLEVFVCPAPSLSSIQSLTHSFMRVFICIYYIYSFILNDLSVIVL